MTNRKRLAAITVTYHPDIELLSRQISRLPEDCFLVAVDNASDPGELAQVEALIQARPNSWLIRNPTNRGLASAINQGVWHAIAQIEGLDTLLLLDQDSVPARGAVEELIGGFERLQAHDQHPGCVGPRLIDTSTGLQHGFHAIKGWRWVRSYPTEQDTDAIVCANINGSGTLIRAALFRELGGLDESLFIDHIDTEWSFRLMANGYKLFGIPQALFEHRMGESGIRFWLFGWRVWPRRSPQRHYFLFRNTIWLVKRHYVPKVWKTWAMVKLLLTLVVYALADPRRGQQLTHMLRGLQDGLMQSSSPVTE